MPSSRRRLRRVRPLLGTFVAIEVSAEADEASLNACLTAGFEAVAEVERQMSWHRDDSDLSRLNRARAGAWRTLRPGTLEVLGAANALFRDSGGAFDVRCGAALVRGGLLPRPRGAARTRPAAARGLEPVELRGDGARKTGPWLLDLGGIAKGYAVDRAVETIRARLGAGRHSGLVDAGGDMRVWGRAARVAVRLRGPVDALTAPFPLRDAALAASSVRAGGASGGALSPAGHARMPEGVLLGSPRTAVVVADRCLLADALTKVALLAPRERAEEVFTRRGASGVVVPGDEGTDAVYFGCPAG